MSHSFKGGIHPLYKKAPWVPVTVITPPSRVVIPMAQHIGAPNVPLVRVGDYVTMGQMIGYNEAPVSAPVHAPVSGTVITVEPRPHPLGDKVLSVVLWNTPTVLPSSVQRKPPSLVPLNSKAVYSPRAISGFAFRIAISFR